MALQNPWNGEFQQGKYYLDRKREMTMRMKPRMKLIEQFDTMTVAPPPYLVGKKGNVYDNNDIHNKLLFEKDDNSKELNQLSGRFQKELSEYGRVYKNYIENINRYVNNQSNEFAGKKHTSSRWNKILY